MFERETRREKILEARNKELRLKEKTKGILNLGGGGLMTIGGGGGGGEGGEGGPNKFGKAAITAIAAPTIGADAKKDAKRVDNLVKKDPTADDDMGDDKKDDKKMGKNEEEEEQEDPIVKAEREFFEIIKKVKLNSICTAIAVKIYAYCFIIPSVKVKKSNIHFLTGTRG